MRNSTSHSIRARFIASFFNNIARSGITFVSVILLARWLGAEDYGRLSFILASLAAFKQLLDMGSASAFITLASQKLRSKNFIYTYWVWIAFQLIVSLLIVSFFIPEITFDYIWNGESRLLIILGLIAVFAQNSVWTTALAMAESQRQTIQAQKINTAVVLIHLFVVILLWVFGKLAIPFLFVALIIEWSFAGWLASKLYSANKKTEKGESFIKILSEFKNYCLPLIPYAWLSFLHDFADRWMLQHWGGSEEQAYFAIARQFSIVSLLAVTSILSIFWKEISEAHHQDNQEKIKVLFQKTHRGLYFLGVFIATTLLPWSREILDLTVGGDYIEGSVTFMLMILYPIYQILGQIGAVMLLATHRTRLHTLLGGFTMVLGLITSYFLMAPEGALVSGLGLASKGLAWKMLIVQFIQVNVLYWFIGNLYGLKVEWRYQIVTLSIALALSCTLKILVLGWGSIPIILSLFIYGLLYLLLTIIFLYFFPSVIGLKRQEFNDFSSSVFNMFK
jgi:O-antigen/teichoic acid export membrane protein